MTEGTDIAATGEAPPQIGAVSPTGRRGAIPGLATPFPLLDTLPAMLQDDGFVQAMMPGFDEVLAPVISVLDCFDSYLDPALAPMDLVRYMGSWVAASFDSSWTDAGIRHAVATVIEDSAWRGTRESIIRTLQGYGATDIEIDEPGSVTVSRTHTDPATWPDTPPPIMTVRYRVPADAADVGAKLHEVVAGITPSNVVVKIETMPA